MTSDDIAISCRCTCPLSMYTWPIKLGMSCLLCWLSNKGSNQLYDLSASTGVLHHVMTPTCSNRCGPPGCDQNLSMREVGVLGRPSFNAACKGSGDYRWVGLLSDRYIQCPTDKSQREHSEGKRNSYPEIESYPLHPCIVLLSFANPASRTCWTLQESDLLICHHLS